MLLALHCFPDMPRTRHHRDTLLHRIRRGYATRHQSLTLGPLQIDFLRCADPDAVLDQVADQADRAEKRNAHRDLTGDTLHLPYWAELWDSSYAIGALLAERDLRQATVLDLGCGMGLTGAAAAFAGASVILADLEPPALLFAAYNTWPWRDRCIARRTDWQTDDLGLRFPLIVGADILYERKQWEHLDRFFRRHLAPGGEILLGEPGRQTGEHFIPWARAQGYSVVVESHPVSTRPVPIRTVTLRL
jgi:predicted nicotinamide N-methyase